jgi:hypothetical protein
MSIFHHTDPTILAKLKQQAEERLGAPQNWQDTIGGAYADIDKKSTVSILVDPPEGTDQISGWGPGWPEDEPEPSDVSQDLPSLDGFDGDDDLVQFTPTGAVITGTPSYELLYTKAAMYMRIGKAAFWNVADTLNAMEAAYGERYAQVLTVAEYLKLSVDTVDQWRWIARTIPMSQRKENVSYRTWRYIAGQDPSRWDQILATYDETGSLDNTRKLLETGEEDPPDVEKPHCPVCGRVMGGSKTLAALWTEVEQFAATGELGELLDQICTAVREGGRDG